ncbi:MAG: xylose isomerase [Ruminococcaceae bacterium]|nr:xylose isomerase [Oscillospiraceae bacterium]
MAIKRGVSLYSYQQTQFFGKMNWKDMVKEVHDNLHTDGIEIINESIIPKYPFPTEEFIYDWNNYLARYGMKAITKDVYLDTMRFRDHVMNYAEAAELLKLDIKIAADMGFQNVRCLSAVPLEVIAMAEETAVKYNVRIGKEIHAPCPILYDPNNPRSVLVKELVEYVDKTGSKHIGLVPDFGIFQHHIPRVTAEHTIRNAEPDKLKFVQDNMHLGLAALKKAYDEKFPTPVGTWGDRLVESFFTEQEQPAQAEHLREIVPYIVSMHGKFYEMTEIEGEPGHYHDAAVDYANPIRILNECGFDGYINSEYEGQRDQQDRGLEYLPDEVKEVRRHHEMLARLSGEGENVITSVY